MLAEGFLKIIKDPTQKDYDHVIPRLDDAIKRVNQIPAIYSKPIDNYTPLFPQSIDLHHILLEIIDISNQVELNKSRKSVLTLALTPENNAEQWNNASLTIDNILFNVKKKPIMVQLLIIDCISLVILLKLSLDDYHFGSRLSGLLEELYHRPYHPANADI